MLLHDGTHLMHAGKPYDPKKAHDYYLRTRKLHPRAKGSEPAKGGRSRSATVGRSKTTKTNSQQLSEQSAYAARRVSELRARLTELTAELRKRLSEARKQEQEAKKGPSTEDKRKAAESSKKYRDSHKQSIANKRTSASGGSSSGVSSKSTDEIKREITNTRLKLKAAVAAQRQLIT